MNALEREIIEKFHQLQPAAKQRVWALIGQEVGGETKQADIAKFNYEAWFDEVEALRHVIRANQSDTSSVDVVGILRDIRDGEDE